MVVLLCVFAYSRHTRFHGAVKGGKRGLPYRYGNPRRCQNVWPLWSGVNNSGKTEVAPAVHGETRIRPVGRTASMAKYGYLGLTRREGRPLRMTVPRRITESTAEQHAGVLGRLLEPNGA